MVNNFFKGLGKALEYALLPGECLLCGQASSQHLDLCQACTHQLPWLLHYCPSCALPLPPEQAGQDCARCLKNPPPFRQIVCPWRYEYPVDGLISDFKYHHRYANGRVLAELCASHIQHHYQDRLLPDLIVPTPLHWWRQWRRGFNQSQRLARHLSKAIGLPVQPCLKRIRATPRQQGLNARERSRNLKGAFVVTQSVRGKTIALIDDVVTTTATVTAMTDELLKTGAAQVDIWCLARTPMPHR